MTLMVGVSGIRGIVGETMTVRQAYVAGRALALSLKETSSGVSSVVMGRDSRPSGEALKNAAAAGLASEGCRVIDLGIVTTPGAALMTRRLGAAGAIIITASHNPSEYNGIKFITARGHAPGKAQVEPINRRFRDMNDDATLTVELLPPAGFVTRDDSTSDAHVSLVLEMVDAELIRSKGFRVALDSVNGAGGPSGRALLEALGCRVDHLHAEPTGLFPHPPEPIEENLRDLARRVAESDAVVGFAQDPDADRLAIVDENGVFIGEEYTLVLAAANILRRHPGPAVVNLSTSRMIDDVAKQLGAGPVHRAAVGEAHVVEMMRARQAVVGGEGNGGVIDPRVGWVRDSLVAMAQTLELLASRDQPLSALVARTPRYHIVKSKVPRPAGGVAAGLARVKRAFPGARVDETDGLRVDLEDAWFQARASNTEPIVRFVAEAPGQEQARRLLDRAIEAFSSD